MIIVGVTNQGAGPAMAADDKVYLSVTPNGIHPPRWLLPGLEAILFLQAGVTG
jgi:hypothetical protein